MRREKYSHLPLWLYLNRVSSSRCQKKQRIRCGFAAVLVKTSLRFPPLSRDYRDTQAEAIAYPAHILNRAIPKLPPQLPHKGVKGARVHILSPRPELRAQIRVAHGLVRGGQQQQQQLPLCQREVDGLL